MKAIAPPQPVELTEAFNIRWLLEQPLRNQKIPCFIGKTLAECETILLRLLKDGYTSLTTKHGITIAS